MGPSVWHKVMTTNLHANWHLLRVFEPLLKRATEPRVVFVTSGVTVSPLAYFGAYSASKAALEMMAKVYAAEVMNSPMKVNLLNPGSIRTTMQAEAHPGRDPMTITPPEEITEAFVRLADSDCPWHGEILYAKEEMFK